ncbi:conserved Plasmodium protein, unknown function [Plasmodium ovale]|uniref:PH domain-containing protein n=1 Tax=Plasmodium ovale TaxID=36330 RepID=A0A1C3KPF4_PLAOA|nr:conserved Plasmodium protein, unknown function [Plasmodium ovale]
MGNTVPYSCYERWGKRTPDGPLIDYDPQMPNNGPLANLLENFNYESNEGADNYNAKADPGNNRENDLTSTHINTSSAHVNTGNNHSEGKNMNVVRNARRRPTYSPTARKVHVQTDDEEYGDGDDDEDGEDDEEEKMSTDNSGKHISAKDLKEEKIKQYRKTITKVVKIKTAIFHETVKVTCSKDGKMLEWYKGKADGDGKKKPIGSFALNKITSIRTKVDNLKSLEIAVSSVNISTYLFIFKTREERESWQNSLESFKKIMSMK